MHSNQRQTLFTIFAIFFIVLLPFIIILSLGYGIDIKKGSVSNNLTVKIQTFPRNADIIIGDTKFQTPSELSIEAGKQVTLTIQKENYFSENFELISIPNQNSTARIEGLWLLPKEPEASFAIDDILNILDKNYLLLEKNGNYGIANYTFAGIRNEFVKIDNPDKVTVKKGTWQVLLQNIFWEQDQNIILHQKNNSQWEFINLKVFPQDFVSVVSLNKNQVLLLDSESNLWYLNLDTKIITFLETRIQGLAFTESPDMVWVLQNDTIFRFDRGGIDPLNINFTQNQFSSSKSIYNASRLVDSKNLNNFVTKNLFLGLVFKIGNSAIYIPDSNKETHSLITTDLKSLGTSGSSIFWLDLQDNLHTYNLLIDQERSIDLPKLDYKNNSEVVLSYYSGWKRLFIYTQDQVVTIWIDLDVNNDSILNYKPFLWLENQSCFGSINNNYQFCNKDNGLVLYKNNSFPFQ